MSQHRQRHVSARAVLFAALLALAAATPAAPAPPPPQRGDLTETVGRRRVALIVTRAQTVDARDPARVAFDLYRKALAGAPPRPHAAAQRAVARLLNKYLNKYRSMTAVETVQEADLVVIFNVLRVRRSFIPEEPHIFGQLFVILRPASAGQAPRIVWQTEDNATNLEEAVGDFLKALRDARGEK